MKDLCETIADDLAIAEHLRLAVDLQQAKLKVRRIAQWQSPYFWAPFVLILASDRPPEIHPRPSGLRDFNATSPTCKFSVH